MLCSVTAPPGTPCGPSAPEHVQIHTFLTHADFKIGFGLLGNAMAFPTAPPENNEAREWLLGADAAGIDIPDGSGPCDSSLDHSATALALSAAHLLEVRCATSSTCMPVVAHVGASMLVILVSSQVQPMACCPAAGTAAAAAPTVQARQRLPAWAPRQRSWWAMLTRRRAVGTCARCSTTSAGGSTAAACGTGGTFSAAWAGAAWQTSRAWKWRHSTCPARQGHACMRLVAARQSKAAGDCCIRAAQQASMCRTTIPLRSFRTACRSAACRGRCSTSSSSPH